MTREDLDFISSMNACDEISDEAYKKIVCHFEGQEPKADSEMTTEEYRQRMIKAFQNAGCGELIALCVLPTEQDFEYLEWLLKNHYKQEPKTEPCEDCISRRAVINAIYANSVGENEYNLTSSRIKKAVEELPSVNPQEPKTGHWINEDVNGIEYYRCSECRSSPWDSKTKCCPDCGARMEGVNE